MSSFVRELSDCFKTKSANGTELAHRYVGGLLSQTQRKNMERMDERLGQDESLCEDNYQATQQFISASPWDEARLYQQICARANERLGGTSSSTLVVDESAQSKKGKASVGVARQWNGRLGKEDNSQVGVYSALNCGNRVTLVGSRLFLGNEWIDDPDRCRRAGVPEERLAQGYLTKIDHARELISEALANGLEFGCVAMDAFYGRDTTLRRFMEDLSLTYCVDVPANARVFVSKPGAKERPKQISKHTVSVAELARQEIKKGKRSAKPISLRQGDAGEVEALVSAVRVWEWTAGEAQPVEMWLITRQMPDGTLKLSLCNADAKTPLKQLARWQAARFWVERCFQDAKSHCGMGQYQARGWLAWHHHMSLVALAVLFQMQERMAHSEALPNLTAADVVELMEWALVKKPTEAELTERILRRHRKRERSALNKREAQRKSR